MAGAPALAATDLAQAPLSFLRATPVKPNILFLLDDSGSMQWSYLDDDVVAYGYENAIGYRSSLCNQLYYDPMVDYPVPVDAQGRPYPPSEFTAARYDGFRPDSPTIDLGQAFMVWRSARSNPAPPDGYSSDCWGDGGQCTPLPGLLANLPGPAHYFRLIGEPPAGLGRSGPDDPCADTREDSPRWTKVTVGARSGLGGRDERPNFANWFSYHRTRILAMRTAVGRAFAQLDGSYRVGFSTISEQGTDVASPGFLPLGDFSGAHREQFYQKLYAITPSASTPLRAALAKAGRLYAGKILTGSADPVQYSCQRNYAILSSDGYWNTTGESGSFGPQQIDGRTDVGDVDRRLPRPMFDGDQQSRPYRLATLTVEPGPVGPERSFSDVSAISVDGLSLMAAPTFVEHHPNADRNDEAALLAVRIAERISRHGFRGWAEQNRVFILAPEQAGELASLPRLDADSAFDIRATAFAPVVDGPRGANTLADVAAYYFETDLRTPALGNCGTAGQLCENNVPTITGQRGGPHQHMVTHTLGLGARGTLAYREDYDRAPDSDFRRIVSGERNWPDPIFSLGPERIDDLWHAAVNGGGRYFSARNTESLSRALAGTLAVIRASSAAAAAAATSSEEPAQGNDLLFSSRYRSLYWDGELEARRISLVDGSIAFAREWSAAEQLQRRVTDSSDNRQIFVPSPVSASGLKPFLWSSLDSGEQALFTGLCPGQPGRQFSHCAQLGELQQRLASGPWLVDYLRGQSRFEDRPERLLRLFRKRESALGAAINAQPLFVGPPAFRYADDHYGEFRDRVAADRAGTVYLAANDGMLHALDAATGNERWAFIPAGVMPALWRSADPAWQTGFRYLLDGTPVAGDVCPTAPVRACTGTDWKTLLVGGLGAAGREYYALDITDPDHPRYLWRFSVDDDSDLGYAVGRPLITKRRDGRWVVVLSSGYNNIHPGSGRGLLFVLDAASGTLLGRIDTGQGSTVAPAGLAQLNAWVDNLLDNTADRLYGGDLLGNVWRFELGTGDADGSGGTALRLAQLVRENRPQPVTTRPVLSTASVGGSMVSLVSIATGSYLGMSDIQDRSVQSLYTLKDTPGSAGLGDVRHLSSVVQQRLQPDEGGAQRSISRLPVDWSSADGWVVDFDAQAGSGERVHLDPSQQLGVLRVVTNLADDSPCRARAESWSYAFNYLDGSYLPIAGDRSVGRVISRGTMVAGVRQLRIGKQIVQVLTDESGSISSLAEPVATGGARPARRVSWRELDLQ